MIVADPSLAIAAFHGWIRAGGAADRGRIYAPKGFPSLPASTGIMGDLVNDFYSASETGPAAAPSPERAEHLFTYVLGNTKSANQTAFAVMQFSKIRRGFLLLKDYARTDAFPERELMESYLMFPSVTFEGHGYILRF